MKDDLNKALGANQSYYERVFEEFEKDPKRLFKWNWASFFFGSLWFLYRKIWPVVFIILTTIILSRLVAESLLQEIMFIIAIGILFSVIGGIFGNWIYYLWLRWLMSALSSRFTGVELSQKLSKYGGTLKLN